jgi:LysM repeat protein
MLGLLAPVVFGVLKRVKRLGGANRFDIARVLAAQRDNIAAATPERVDRDTYIRSRVEPRERVTETHAETRRMHAAGQRHSWILPVALLLGALGLIWYWGSRPRGTAYVPPSIVHAGREETTRLSFNDLKSKYSSVIQEAQDQGVQISEMREQDGKLIIKGTAPSLDAANNVWNEIKRVNPSLDDITASVEVIYAEPDAASAMSQGQTYTVQPGDTLMSISKHFYGNAGDYTRILGANGDKIENKNLIRVGEELSIP